MRPALLRQHERRAFDSLKEKSDRNMNILITGGTGYIGSHICLSLLQAGHSVIALDNLSNSSELSLRRVAQIAGRSAPFIRGDINDEALLERLFSENSIDAVIHLAGYKAVGESVAQPLPYYRNNVTGTLALLEVMRRHGVKRMLFSSSATVYAPTDIMPITEDAPIGAQSPYGRTKVFIEQILRDLYESDSGWSITLLRYFNPVGAHESGRIGEAPGGIPNNLMPRIVQAACGSLRELSIFGRDYPTPDGTCVRDYIHIADLAEGHAAALDQLCAETGFAVYNLGTGRGTSVLELIHAFEAATGKEIPFLFADRRPGDAAACWADPSRARSALGWQAKRNLAAMCADVWRWHEQNPNGYAE